MYIGYLVFNSEKSDRGILIQIIDITKAIRDDTGALQSMVKPTDEEIRLDISGTEH
jgi:hypothetical protein